MQQAYANYPEGSQKTEDYRKVGSRKKKSLQKGGVIIRLDKF